MGTAINLHPFNKLRLFKIPICSVFAIVEWALFIGWLVKIANMYNQKDTIHIVESNRTIREVIMINCSNEYYTVKFAKGNCGIRLRKSRIFPFERSGGINHESKNIPKTAASIALSFAVG